MQNDTLSIFYTLTCDVIYSSLYTKQGTRRARRGTIIVAPPFWAGRAVPARPTGERAELEGLVTHARLAGAGARASANLDATVGSPSTAGDAHTRSAF